MGPLHSVPETPPRVLGLIRVSKERDGMISPDVQRVAIADYAAARGYDVTSWLEGIDESGSRAKSAWWPRLDQAVAQVEAGTVDIIVVWKFSRVARHRLKWAVALDRVETAGGRVESATEQVDVSTSTGRFTRGMLSELQAFEAERIGEVWKEVQARRVAKGLPPSGRPKWGYRYNPETKLHEPDPVTGPMLADLYQRYVSGESFYRLAQWLNQHQLRTLTGGPWHDTVLRTVMDAGFGAGLITYHQQTLPGAHQPVIDEELWQTYLDARTTRRLIPARSKRSPYLLTGLVRCGECGHRMHGNVTAGGKPPRYRCSKRRMVFGQEPCPGTSMIVPAVDDAVRRWLEDFSTNIDAAASAAGSAATDRMIAAGDRTRLLREIVRIDEAMTRLTARLAEDVVSELAYKQTRHEFEQRRTRLVDQAEDAARRARRRDGEAGQTARRLLEEWDTMILDARQQLLRSLIDTVLVRARGTTRTVVIPVWEARVDQM